MPSSPPSGRVEFLTAEWAAALESDANASTAFRDACRGVALTIEQVVTEDSGDGEVCRYALTFDDGALRVRWGGVRDDADVTFVENRDTAERLSRGTLNAQQAFVLGKLRVGGKLERLQSARDAFVGLEDVLADLRARTAYP